MAVALDIMHGCDPSNEMHCLLAKDTVLTINTAAKGVFCRTLLTRQSALILYVGVHMGSKPLKKKTGS